MNAIEKNFHAPVFMLIHRRRKLCSLDQAFSIAPSGNDTIRSIDFVVSVRAVSFSPL